MSLCDLPKVWYELMAQRLAWLVKFCLLSTVTRGWLGWLNFSHSDHLIVNPILILNNLRVIKSQCKDL